jgi:hemerythrin-like metal-binding protein
MATIEWTDDLKLGVPAIDAEHRELLRLTNEVLEAVSGAAASPELVQTMARLIARAEGHFAAEELLLDRNNYPQLAAHRAEHARLITEARRLRDRLAAISGDNPEQQEELRQLPIEAANYFRRWLLDHILAEDRPYRPFLMRLT